MKTLRWKRTDQSDGASEILTIVRIDGDFRYYVEICSGPNVGDDFVGLYTLEGDQVRLSNCSWEVVSNPPREIIVQIETDWESGSNVIERLEDPS